MQFCIKLFLVVFSTVFLVQNIYSVASAQNRVFGSQNAQNNLLLEVQVTSGDVIKLQKYLAEYIVKSYIITDPTEESNNFKFQVVQSPKLTTLLSFLIGTTIIAPSARFHVVKANASSKLFEISLNKTLSTFQISDVLSKLLLAGVLPTSLNLSNDSLTADLSQIDSEVKNKLLNSLAKLEVSVREIPLKSSENEAKIKQRLEELSYIKPNSVTVFPVVQAPISFGSPTPGTADINKPALNLAGIKKHLEVKSCEGLFK